MTARIGSLTCIFASLPVCITLVNDFSICPNTCKAITKRLCVVSSPNGDVCIASIIWSFTAVNASLYTSLSKIFCACSPEGGKETDEDLETEEAKVKEELDVWKLLKDEADIKKKLDEVRAGWIIPASLKVKNKGRKREREREFEEKAKR